IRDLTVTGVQTCALPIFNLKDEQKALWAELLAMNFEMAQMASRYFCLNGEPFVSMRVIGAEYGYIHATNMLVSRKINAVIAYLRSEERRVGKECRFRWVS